MSLFKYAHLSLKIWGTFFSFHCAPTILILAPICLIKDSTAPEPMSIPWIKIILVIWDSWLMFSQIFLELFTRFTSNSYKLGYSFYCWPLPQFAWALSSFVRLSEPPTLCRFSIKWYQSSTSVLCSIVPIWLNRFHTPSWPSPKQVIAALWGWLFTHATKSGLFWKKAAPTKAMYLNRLIIPPNTFLS
jgi:hypothetical protein